MPDKTEDADAMLEEMVALGFVERVVRDDGVVMVRMTELGEAAMAGEPN